MQTTSEFTMAVSGAGHAAMECALANTIEPGDVLLSAVAGLWGERAIEIGKRHGQQLSLK
jgi:alanine-glyoxylate transaminase/serine-glyoxylate transaminase/serine-pyruvate transaminase